MANMIKRSLLIKKSLGTFTAARYLAKRGVSLEAALYILVVSA